MNEMSSKVNGTHSWVLPAVAAGAAFGIALAASHRKRNHWHATRKMTERVLDKRQELAEAGKDLADRIQTIYHESRVVARQVTQLWQQGRKMLTS